MSCSALRAPETTYLFLRVIIDGATPSLRLGGNVSPRLRAVPAFARACSRQYRIRISAITQVQDFLNLSTNWLRSRRFCLAPVRCNRCRTARRLEKILRVETIPNEVIIRLPHALVARPSPQTKLNPVRNVAVHD